MFEFIQNEISEIKTPHFHMVDGPADVKLQEAIRVSSIPVPPSYKQFVEKFGNAKLYRKNGAYKIGVFASPRQSLLKDGTVIYHLGFHDGASVYIKPSATSLDLPIFEFEEELEEKVANSFDEWLIESCADARESYGKDIWEKILRGPDPFTPEELKMIGARRLLHWEVLGVDASGNHVFEIENQGQRILPVLTVGVRSKDGRLNGAVRLDVSQVGPGQKKIIHVDCYKVHIKPQLVEVFALPDPKPEDRDLYWEFRDL